MNAYLLVAVGLVAIFVEFFLPGGVMGTVGGGCVVAALVLIAVQSDSMLEVGLFYVGTVVALWALIKFALWRIAHSTGEGGIYSGGDQEGYSASGFDREAIGKSGVVQTDLKPGGHVLIEGKSHQALSQTGYVSKGEEVTVVGGQGESLIVKKGVK
ncbi:MAG: serine protease [Chlamydiia bacterium]|nr:serine protease [Chlamydiia bacterium]